MSFGKDVAQELTREQDVCDASRQHKWWEWRTFRTNWNAVALGVGRYGKMCCAADTDAVLRRGRIWTSYPRCRMLASSRAV